jgi:hypothetical protein
MVSKIIYEIPSNDHTITQVTTKLINEHYLQYICYIINNYAKQR